MATRIRTNVISCTVDKIGFKDWTFKVYIKSEITYRWVRHQDFTVVPNTDETTEEPFSRSFYLYWTKKDTSYQGMGEAFGPMLKITEHAYAEIEMYYQEFHRFPSWVYELMDLLEWEEKPSKNYREEETENNW